MKDEEEIGNWFDDAVEPENDALQQVLDKTKAANSRKDTMDLVFVKIWAAMMVLLAPLFANLNKAQANSMTQRRQQPDTLNTDSSIDAPNNNNDSDKDSSLSGEHRTC